MERTGRRGLVGRTERGEGKVDESTGRKRRELGRGRGLGWGGEDWEDKERT